MTKDQTLAGRTCLVTGASSGIGAHLAQRMAQAGALAALARQSGLAALVATHNHALAERMDRVVSLEDGRLVEA